MEISEQKLIRVSFGVIGAVTMALLGGVFWLTTIYNTGEANAEAIRDFKVLSARQVEALNSIDRRLSNIEGYLKANKGE